MSDPNPPLPYAADLELLQMAASTLMTRFYGHACPGIARAVVRHLEEILKHPRIQTSLVVQQGYAALLEQWSTVLERSRETFARQHRLDEPVPAKPVIH